MIAGVLRLGNRTAKHGHARYLVCNGRLEELEGVVVARDILPELIDGTPMDLRSQMQPALVVHDRLTVVRLIEHLKTTPTRLAIVVDGHGNIDGIVTPTDVLATIAGDLVEAEDAEPKPVRLPDGSIQFDGASPIDEVAEILELPAMAEDGEYTTIAGFVLWRLGHIPEANESFQWENWRFLVSALEGHRIKSVVAYRALEQTA